jgi:hypothetical protein
MANDNARGDGELDPELEPAGALEAGAQSRRYAHTKRRDGSLDPRELSTMARLPRLHGDDPPPHDEDDLAIAVAGGTKPAGDSPDNWLTRPAMPLDDIYENVTRPALLAAGSEQMVYADPDATRPALLAAGSEHMVYIEPTSAPISSTPRPIAAVGEFDARSMRGPEVTPAQVRGATPAQTREPTPAQVRGATPSQLREPTPARREVTPSQMRGPTPSQVREPTPPRARGSAPPDTREPTPARARASVSPEVREPSREPLREPTPLGLRETEPAALSQPGVRARSQNDGPRTAAAASSGAMPALAPLYASDPPDFEGWRPPTPAPIAQYQPPPLPPQSLPRVVLLIALAGALAIVGVWMLIMAF